MRRTGLERIETVMQVHIPDCGRYMRNSNLTYGCAPEQPCSGMQKEVGMARFEIEVQLTGDDGNAFAVLGKVRAALRYAGATEEEIQSFMRDATSDDYDHLLRTCMEWVVVA